MLRRVIGCGTECSAASVRGVRRAFDGGQRCAGARRAREAGVKPATN